MHIVCSSDCKVDAVHLFQHDLRECNDGHSMKGSLMGGHNMDRPNVGTALIAGIKQRNSPIAIYCTVHIVGCQPLTHNLANRFHKFKDFFYQGFPCPSF